MIVESTDSTGTEFGPRDEALAAARRGRRVRRISVTAMAVFVAAGMFGVLGTRHESRVMATGNVTVELHYPAVTRGGLPVRWTLDVRSTDGSPLPAEIEVRTTSAYFRLFDHHDLDPEPDAVWQDELLSWTFRPEGDDRLLIELDVRAQPNARWRYAATTDVIVDDASVASFDYTTFVVP